MVESLCVVQNLLLSASLRWLTQLRQDPGSEAEARPIHSARGWFPTNFPSPVLSEDNLSKD